MSKELSEYPEKREKNVMEMIPSFKLPKSLPEFIAFFENKLASIPAECRSGSKIWMPVSAEEGVEILYTRIETEDEAEKRIAQMKTFEDALKQRELEELNRLKKKYENNE